MTGNNTAVFGIFRTWERAEEAVDMLTANGYRRTDVSVLMTENVVAREYARERRTRAVGDEANAGTLDLLAGIGTLTMPGLKPLIAAGPIVTDLASVGAAGAGGLAGGLVAMGIPEQVAERYEGRVELGHVLLSVHCEDVAWTKNAKAILDRTGADEICSTNETSRPQVRHGSGSVGF